MFARSDRAEEDIAGNARSPSKEAPSERVKKVQINNHRNMFASGFVTLAVGLSLSLKWDSEHAGFQWPILPRKKIVRSDLLC